MRGASAALAFVLLTLLAAGVPASRAAPDAASEPAAAPHVLHVVGADNFPPYLFRDEDGRPTGLVADEWALWAKKTGVHVDLQPVDWADAMHRVASGDADVIDTIFWSSERARMMDFTAPFADVREPIYAERSVQGLVDLHSLKGFHVARCPATCASTGCAPAA